MVFPLLADVSSGDHAGFRPPLRSEVTLRAAPDEFIERQRRRITVAAAQAPTEVDGFVEWFQALKDQGPGQRDALFPFLAERASLFEMRWVLNQEMGGEHSPRLDDVARALGLDGTGVVREVRVLRRLVGVLQHDARYAFQAVGVLAATALTAPARAASIQTGLQRLGLIGDVRRPLSDAAFDVECLRPLVQARPEHATAIAEGALMRLRAGARCYERYRRELGFVEPLERRAMLVVDAQSAEIFAR